MKGPFMPPRITRLSSFEKSLVGAQSGRSRPMRSRRFHPTHRKPAYQLDGHVPVVPVRGPAINGDALSGRPN
jgi:hypothetical protein